MGFLCWRPRPHRARQADDGRRADHRWHSSSLTPVFAHGLPDQALRRRAHLLPTETDRPRWVPFWCYKFRSMVPNAEALRAELAARNVHGEAGITFKVKARPADHSDWSIIRKTSIDELPQLFNVIRGEMSLVGPRPPLPSEVAQYDDSATPPTDRPARPDLPLAGERPGRAPVRRAGPPRPRIH